MLSVALEKPITLGEVAGELGVSLRTVQRWTRGVPGRRLETFRCGRVVRTSWQALERFQQASEAASRDPGQQHDEQYHEQHQRRIEAALRARHGIESDGDDIDGDAQQWPAGQRAKAPGQ